MVSLLERVVGGVSDKVALTFRSDRQRGSDYFPDWGFGTPEQVEAFGKLCNGVATAAENRLANYLGACGRIWVKDESVSGGEVMQSVAQAIERRPVDEILTDMARAYVDTQISMLVTQNKSLASGAVVAGDGRAVAKQLVASDQDARPLGVRQLVNMDQSRHKLDVARSHWGNTEYTRRAVLAYTRMRHDGFRGLPLGFRFMQVETQVQALAYEERMAWQRAIWADGLDGVIGTSLTKVAAAQDLKELQYYPGQYALATCLSANPFECGRARNAFSPLEIAYGKMYRAVGMAGFHEACAINLFQPGSDSAKALETSFEIYLKTGGFKSTNRQLRQLKESVRDIAGHVRQEMVAMAKDLVLYALEIPRDQGSATGSQSVRPFLARSGGIVADAAFCAGLADSMIDELARRLVTGDKAEMLLVPQAGASNP